MAGNCGPALLSEDSTHGQVACSNWLTDWLTHSLAHSACSSCVVWTWQPLLLRKILYSRFSILNTKQLSSASTLVTHAFFMWAWSRSMWVWLRWTISALVLEWKAYRLQIEASWHLKSRNVLHDTYNQRPHKKIQHNNNITTTTKICHKLIIGNRKN